MVEQSVDVQSFISRELHNLLFLEEFVFARNRFSPPEGSELELADAVVMLGDVLLIYQIKERSLSEAGDAVAERRWFDSKVLRKATKQLRDTLTYLQKYSEIRVLNERGHPFNLAGNRFADIIKVVVYKASPNLPDDRRRIRHHVSRSAGFIHIVNAVDYLEIGRTLRVPQEVVRYLKYRETILTPLSREGITPPEAAIAGHFIGGDSNVAPTIDSVKYLYQLVQDEENWNLAPFLRRLYDHLSEPGISDDYYKILIEFAKLSRSAWRVIKERILLCIEKVRNNEIAKPYRISVSETGCGFVFVPVDVELMRCLDEPTSRLRGLENYTLLHKYDQRLSKCVGVQISPGGDYFNVDWCLIEHEWSEEPELQRILDELSPFRPVRAAWITGYQLNDAERPE